MGTATYDNHIKIISNIFRNSPSESFPLRFVGFSRQKCFRHWMSWFSDITRRIVDCERCDAGNVEIKKWKPVGCRLYLTAVKGAGRRCMQVDQLILK